MRDRAALHGGSLEESPKPWSFDGCEVWDGVDHEGNVIQSRVPQRP